MAATSAYTRQGLVQLIRDDISEPVARIFTSGTDTTGDTETDLERFIDMGAEVCAGLTNGYEITQTGITPVANEAWYTIGTTGTVDFVRVESVEYIVTSGGVSYGLQRVNPQVMGGSVANVAGRPLYYFVHPFVALKKIWVWPTPSSVEAAAGTLVVKGYGIPLGFGVGGSETLVDGLQLTPLYYALSCVYARLGKHQLSALNMQKFIDECNRWRMDVYGDINRVDSYDLTRIPDVSVTVQ